jgi:hypothetical protein
VRASLTRIFQDRTSTSEADAQAWLAGLRLADRFVEDTWEADAVPVLGAVADEPPAAPEGGRRHPAAAVART